MRSGHQGLTVWEGEHLQNQDKNNSPAFGITGTAAGDTISPLLRKKELPKPSLCVQIHALTFLRPLAAVSAPGTTPPQPRGGISLCMPPALGERLRMKCMQFPKVYWGWGGRIGMSRIWAGFPPPTVTNHNHFFLKQRQYIDPLVGGEPPEATGLW
jgi:hypothetical protein